MLNRLTSDLRPKPLPRLGHIGRWGMSGRERLLVMGHLAVVALALQDEELVAAAAARWQFSSGFWNGVDVAANLVILALWALLTLAWVRCRRDGDAA
jgi:hypothetical protein